MAAVTSRSGLTITRLATWCGIAFASMLSPGAAAPGEREGCVRDFRAGVDYFEEKAELQYARGFSVSYHGHYKVLTVGGAARDTVSDVLVLVQCGTPAPSLDGDLANATVITIPARTIAANEDLSLTRARVLGHVDRVVGIGSEGVYAPELRKRWETGAAISIGASFHGEPKYEKLLAVAPDLVILSTASLARADSIKRARDLELPAVPTMSWVETSVLGQAEWLHQVAIFVNAEAKANRILGEIKERYRKLSARARAHAAQPTIIWLDPAQQRDQWRVPENNWIAQLIVDAGGRTPFAQPGGAPTRIVTTEQVLGVANRAHAFVTTTTALSTPGSAGALEVTDALVEGRLYDVHRRSRPEHDAYDWYESATVQVDRVLADFVALLHPEVLPAHDYRYLQPMRPNAANTPRSSNR